MWQFLLAGLLAAGAADAQVKSLDGSTSKGELAALGAEELVLKADGQDVRLKRADVLSIELPAAEPAKTPPAVWLELADGSLVPAASYAVSETTATISLFDETKLELPTKAIASVRFMAVEGDLEKQWEQIRGQELTGDLIVIAKKDGKSLDYQSGVVRDVTDDKVHFELDGETIPVARGKVAGVVYFHPRAPELAELACTISGSDGFRFWAKSVELSEGKLRMTGLTGVEIVRPLASVERLDFSAGKIQYLSDLKPEVSRWTPYFPLASAADAVAEFGRPRNDQSQEGGPLKLGGKDHARGLALRSKTELVYRLPSGFNRLEALAGIDDRVRDGGHVRLVITADDKPLFDKTIAGGDEPLPISLDIAGVKRLKIVVDYGDDQDFSDYLDLCDARIIK